MSKSTTPFTEPEPLKNITPEKAHVEILANPQTQEYQTPSFHFRDPTLNDLPAINALLRSSKGYWGYDDDFMNIFMEKFGFTEEQLKNDTSKLFYKDDQLIGIYTFSIDKNKLYLENFFIAPSFIGNGFGKFIWAKALATMQDLNFDGFTLWSDPNADSFYKKMGCEHIDEVESPMMAGRMIGVYQYSI